mgnify:FL=1
MKNLLKNIIIKLLYLLISIYLIIFIPSIWGEKPLVILSGSMEPILKVGGILYYKQENINNFKEGDVLVYQLNDHTISHRIVKVLDDSFITKGDNNKSIDTYEVLSYQILGKGTNWSIPYIGYYADFIYNHKYLLVIATGLIFIDILYDNKKEKIKNEEDN